MGTIKTLVIASVCSILALSVTSCLSDNSGEPVYEITFSNGDISFNVNDYWAYCYDIETGSFNYGPFSFSHYAWADEWNGVTYPSWKGFCPARVNDTESYPNDWVNHQWATIVPNPMGQVYLVGNSESQVSENPLDNTKCTLRMSNYSFFNPKYAYVTNSSYAYYSAKDGSDFNEAFTATDTFVLHVVGVRMGVMTGHLQFALMANQRFLNEWAGISLEELGTVDEVLFYIDSTKKNSYGLTVPAYFCLGGIGYNIPETTVSE